MSIRGHRPENEGPAPVVTVFRDLTGDNEESLEEQVNEFISTNHVVIFARSTCPFCIDAKEFLSQQMGVNVTVVEVDNLPEGSKILKMVQKKTNHATVPIIFIRGTYVGGCHDVKALHSKGELEPMLEGLVVRRQTSGTHHLETAKLVPMDRGDARHPLFWFPNTVNNLVVRLTGFLVMTLAVLSAAFLNDLWGRYMAVALLVDFVLRMVAGASLSPLGMIATTVTSFKQPEFRPGPPKQFAAFCGVIFSALGTIFYFVSFPGHQIVGAVFMGFLAVAAGMEAFIDFCLGCLFFSYGVQFGLVPKSVYRIYTTTKSETQDSWEYKHENSDASPPELVDTDPTSKVALRYKKKSDAWTKDDFDMIRHMQVSYFGMPMAIAGLGVAYKMSSDWSDFLPGDRRQIVPDAWYIVCAVMAAVVFCIMLVLYTVRAVKYWHKIKREWDCPLRSCGFGTIPICFMLFSFLVYDEIRDVNSGSRPQTFARVIFWMGAIAQCLLTVAKMGEWIGKRLELEHVHTQWMIFPVGLSVAALMAPIIPMFDESSSGYDAVAANFFLAQFFYSFALLMWVTLFVITFFKVTTTHNSDNRFRHGVFIWMAAPCVIGLANLSICLADGFSSLDQCQGQFSQYYFMGMFFFMILFWATLPYVNFFGRDAFSMHYWTECFALDTLAACAAAFNALNGYRASQTLMFIGLAIASICNVCALLHTLTALVRRRNVFTPEVKWGPLSFMKLTHEALRGNMEKLQWTLDTLDVRDRSSQSERKFGLFAAHYNRFCIVHDEHSKHEDEVIFKTFNDYFPAHAKEWCEDHDEDYKKMDSWHILVNKILDFDLDEEERQSALDTLRDELPAFFDHLLQHLQGEEENLQPIAKKYIPLELAKQIARECFLMTPADKWEVIIPFIVNNIPHHVQRVRYIKVLCWSMPERAQQIGAILYRNVDAVMWERLRVEVPEIIPRAADNWRRYY